MGAALAKNGAKMLIVTRNRITNAANRANRRLQNSRQIRPHWLCPGEAACRFVPCVDDFSTTSTLPCACQYLAAVESSLILLHFSQSRSYQRSQIKSILKGYTGPSKSSISRRLTDVPPQREFTRLEILTADRQIDVLRFGASHIIHNSL